MKKRIGVSNHLMIYISIFLLTINVVLGVILSRLSITALREQIHERMLDISNSAAALLDGDVMARLQKEDVDTPEYQEALRILGTFQEQVQLSYIYGIRDMGNKNFVFTIDPEPVDPGEFGSPIVYTDALYEASLGHSAVDQIPYQDEWGNFYSSYSPIFDSNGNVAGIVGVDFEAEWYERQVHRHIYIIVFACVLSLLGGGALVFLFTSNLRKRFLDLSKEMGKMTYEIEELAVELRLTTGVHVPSNDVPVVKKHFHKSTDILEDFHSKLKEVRVELREYIASAHKLAYTDPLTGIGNRNAYLERVNVINDKIEDEKASFSVAIFDINGLKNANDDLGHQSGDLMILYTAEILKEVFTLENVFRIGGDEFVVLLENSDEDVMQHYFTDVSQKVNEKKIIKDDKTIPLAVSKGFAIFEPLDKVVKDVFRRADDKMYADKAAYYATHADRRRKR